MGSGHPTPVQPLLPGKAQIIQKTLTYEINGAVRQVGPDEGGNCFGDRAQLLLALANLFFRAFAIFDVGSDPIPLDDVSIFISERHSAVQLPAILSIRAAGTELLFEGLSGRKLLSPFY